VRAVPGPARSDGQAELTSRLRRGVALLAAALVAVACGTGPGPAAEVPTSLAPVPDADPEVPDPTLPPGSPAPPSPSPGATVAPGAPAAPPAVAPPAAAGPVTAAEVPDPGGVGSLAGWYLRPAAAPAITVEVRSQDGAGPRSGGVTRVRDLLAQISGKPVSVTTGSLPGSGRTWSADDLRAIADQGAPQATDRAVLRLLFLHGGFAENERAVGVAVRGDVAAVFADRVVEAAGVFGDRDAVEDAVTMHEVGHLLGLVDLALDTRRGDPEHPGHSPNRRSVMYYAVESTLLATVFSGGPPRDFDAADLADLAAIRDA